MRPVIVSCAVTGRAGTTELNPVVPRTPAEAVTIVEALGEMVATPAEARRLPGLG